MKLPYAIGLMAVMVFAGGCEGKKESEVSPVSAAPQAGLPLATVTVATSPVPIRVEVTGRVESLYQATLSSRIQGTIDKLLVREGTPVVKGQTLIQLDNRDLTADLARATAELENNKAQFERMKNLYQQEAVSKQELENATRSYKVADAARKAVLAQLSYTIVKAPFDGVITEKKVEVGELASPGQPLLKMEDPNQLRLEAIVAESDLQALAVGDRVPVTIDALAGQTLTGVVSRILTAGDPQTHTFAVKVDLPPTPGLKTGMFGRLQLDKGTSQSILLPASALVERGEMTSVYVVGPDRIARLRWVKIGRHLGDQREVLSGLNVGERVLLEGARGVDGAPVQVLEPAATPLTTSP